jgi:hypothetical protein
LSAKKQRAYHPKMNNIKAEEVQGGSKTLAATL